MKKTVNWLLYETHRWLGIVLALFMFVWFGTGLVIMYAKPMASGLAEQWSHSERLAPEQGWLSLGEVWARNPTTLGTDNAGKSGEKIPLSIADARLVRRAGQPLWLIEDTRGKQHAWSALDGSPQTIGREQALAIVQQWLEHEEGDAPAELTYLESLDKTSLLRNRDAYAPFHRVADTRGRHWLISARTGDVLHASTRLDRALFYAGNWLHLFKPLEDLGLGHIRHDVQLWSGLGATIACFTGLIIGWLRWRPGWGGKPTYSQGRTQPYRESWAKWHFWSGLLGGGLSLAWAFSGVVDTNPGKVFSEPNPDKVQLARYLGDRLPDAMMDWRPSAAVIKADADVVELNWRRLGDKAVLLSHERTGKRDIYPFDDQRYFGEADLRAAAVRMGDGQQVSVIDWLEMYDDYYYPRHHQDAVDKPLPVLKVELADPAGTRYYLDPKDGKVLLQADNSRRVFRWLYSALHHWDFAWLYYRPAWDVWMLTWVGFGVVLGASSLVIGWRRLKKTFAPKRKRVIAGTKVPEPRLVVETASD